MSTRARASSAHISPSAHFTGYVWYRHNLSDPAFVTGFGRFAHTVLRPLTALARRGFGLDLEHLLLQRHRFIDERLHAAIEQQGVTQIVEIACGLSPRGRRFVQAHSHIRYIEADLPDMAERKRQLLGRTGWLGEHQQVCAVDILATDGELALSNLFARLDKTQPVAVITEGLVNYFELSAIEGFWTRLAEQLSLFPSGRYLTDLYPDLQDHPRYRQMRWGVDLVGRLTRGSYPLHYRDEVAIEAGFKGCGFAAVQVFDPAAQQGDKSGLLRMVEATA
ncbi:class I SAM-dependent methyltransferase [Pseudomonas sp. TTU2014-080ASC]|uniref:class I SAM-dependent methyltransferase n=1 Tax=Pseudomonas sp. TTU2014-080ASC TaxID=1729724 RepID=UPI0007184880|nr:class I SAM-dependent methyltransferase [Pseudomonas sp. TTU2014-080ASC]KRW57530.1 polyketide biosynthesis methyltransferase [Pseudomonas sp. TTU2014-080ASC]